nr:PREDICTED: oxygen-regulated protein 1 [Struthio camelus australis]
MSETPSTSYSVNQPNSSESEQTLSTRHFNVTEPVVAKRICFYKSGDPQFNGIKMVVNNRSYKTFDALLDSLSKRVPLPFGVRNISTPKGRHSITNLEDLEDGKSYICSHQRKIKPINLERARKKPLPWQISRPVSARRRAVQLAKENEDGFGQRESKVTTPKKLLVFKNGDVRLRRTIVLGKKNTQTFEAFLDYMSELMQYPVVKLYTTDGRKVPNLQALILCSGAVVAAGREPFKPSNYDPLGYSRPAKLLGMTNRVYPKANAKSENEKMRVEKASSSRSQIFSVSSDKGSSNDNTTNDNNSDSSYAPDNYKGVVGNQSLTGEDLSVAQYEDDIEKSVHLNQDGSMTVEMKVRFKIKEEETIKWTTTVSRAGLSDDKNIDICDPARGAEDCLSNINVSACIKPKEAPFLENYSNEAGVSLQQFGAEVSDKESESDLKTADYSICQINTSADLDVSNVSEDKTRPRFYRPPTPGPRRVRQKKAVVESVTLVSEKEVQEKTIGQFSYSEETQDGESKSEYCMVAHSSSKKSSVSNPKLSEMSDNDLLKLSSENMKKEEMLFKVSHKSHDLIDTSNRKTLDVPDKDELLKKILEKLVIEQDTYNGLVSTCKDSMNSRLKVQDSMHSACPRHSQIEMMTTPSSKAPIEQINPITGFFPTVTESENQIGSRTESVTATHPTDESQPVPPLTKKKRKSLSNFLEQGIHENQKDEEFLGIIKGQATYITSKTTQNSTIQAANYSEMPQKKGMEFFVKTSDGSVNSDKSIHPEDEFCHQVSVQHQQNGLSSNKKTRADRQLTKEKKQKRIKKNLSKAASKLSMSERALTLELLKQGDFQDEVAEHSPENYVQTWLKNLLPNAVLPPINKKEGNVENTNACPFPKENIDTFIGKETRFITNKVHVTRKNNLIEHNLTKKTLKPLCELGAIEESAKHSCGRQTDSLINANTAIIEEANYLRQSDFHHGTKLLLFHEAHDKDKKKAEADVQDTNLYQRKSSEVAVQVDSPVVGEKMGIEVQNNCLSSTLLHELQSALLGLQKEHSGCIGKACSLSDLSPSVFGSSCNLLIAWLLVLNLRESLVGTIKDDMQKTTCSCSEMFAQLPFLKQTTVIEKIDELKGAVSHFEQSTENNLLQSGRELKNQDSTHCHENMPVSEIHSGIHLHKNENSVASNFPKDSINSEEAQKFAGELESCSDIQKELYIATETSDLNDLSAPKTLLYGKNNSDNCSLPSAVKPPERNEEMADDSLQQSQDENADASLSNEESGTSVEPNSTVHSVTSNDKNRILDQVTSEVEDEKDIIHITTNKNKDEKVGPKSADDDEKPNNQLKQASDTSTEYDYEDDSTQEGRKDTETHEETSERLSTPSPLSFCYESKQITECDVSEGEQKSQVEALENRTCSDTSQLKKCLKSPATSDWSDYRPDSEESDYNFRASSDLTNESGEEAVLEKHYNTGYVKRTIERLYGKTEASFKPHFHTGVPYMSKVFQKDTEVFHSTVVEKKVSFFQEPRSYSAEKLSHPLPSQEFPENVSKDDIMRRRENISLPAPQPTLKGEETTCTNNCSGESRKHCCQPSIHPNEDEGILIDNGKWLLKENHLIRRSPPERIGMYGNLDTTSTDTVFDTNSEDAPYSHFGNLTQYPVLNEISSSELEDMAKPSENVCYYFNVPHNSDSDPFPDDLSTKNKPSLNCKITSLPVGNKEKINPSVMVCSTSKCLSTETSTSFPPFTSVEFRLPDNKVHPLEQPLSDEPIQSQPTDVSNANRSALQEEDSLDKLHAICGQHCPILMAIVIPINEEQRGYAYQKASDIENQLGLCLSAKKSQHLPWSGKDLIKDENHRVTMKGNCISKIANNIFNRFYANNMLDFVNNFGVLTSSTLKDRSNLGKLHFVEDMKVNPVEISNCQNSVSKHTLSDVAVGPNSELPDTKQKICQSLRISLIHIVEEKLSPLLTDPAEACHSEILLKCETSLNSVEHNASEILKNENVYPTGADEEAGKWKLSVRTGDMPTAGTSSQVYVTLYGDRSSSGPIFLDGEEGKLFQRGNEDIFTINTGNIGDLYKIRIGHTNAGNFPAWRCDEVQLLNLYSGEQFYFPAHRWLAWDQADGEICLELPVLHQGQPILPVTVYEVHVTTGELWNAGTEADVYMSVYGEKGDTGSRQLHRSQKPKNFLKGQTDIFPVEAVHLGPLYKIVIGHNGLGSGNGWFLDKVVIKDPITDLDYTFLCHRWLDHGQDDGKIARELTVTDASPFSGRQELELKREESWAAEKWKFQEGNTLQFYNRLTRGFICLNPDGKVDALGDKKNKYGLFDVIVKRRNTCIFSSHQMPHLALAVVNGHVTGKHKGETHCELCVHLQPNCCAILESARNPGHTVTFSLQGKVADETTGYAGLSKEFVVHVKDCEMKSDPLPRGGAKLQFNRVYFTMVPSFCSTQASARLSPLGLMADAAERLHKVSSGVCMFESVRNPRMYLKIKDGQCNGTGTGDEYCHFKIEHNLESGSVSLESVRNKGIYVGLLPDGQAKPVIHTGERNILFYPQVIKFGRKEPMGTSAAPNRKKKEFREFEHQPAYELSEHQPAQKPVSESPLTFPPTKEMRNPQGVECPLPSDDEWKVSVLKGNSGTQVNVTLWIYGDRGIAGPITLVKDNREQLFLPRQEDEFQIKIKSIGNIYKIRIEHEGASEQSEWNLQRVTLQHLKSKKVLNFPANTWLSKTRDNRDLPCELPVVEAGKPVYPIILYHVYVYTGHLEQADTDSAVYLCIYGKRGDTGLRPLHKSGMPVKFQRGMVNAFEVGAVSLGKLQKVLLRCEANTKSQYWYCDKVVVREAEKTLEYVFSCERWLPFMSQGVIHSEIELYPQEGDWKITVVTGDFETAGTTATVSLYAYGENKASGPIILGSGKHQLFNPNSADTFKINLRDLGQLYKIRIGHDNTGDDPSWYLEEVRLQRVVPISDQEIRLPIECWLAEDKDDGDTWREVAIRNLTKELLPLLVYEIHVYTGSKLGAETDSNVYINLIGTRGDAGKRKLHRSKNNSVKFQHGQMDIFCIKAVSLGDLEKILISHDGAGPGNGWFLDKIVIRHEEGKEAQETVFPCNRWLDEYQDDGKTERELTAKKYSNAKMAFSKAQQWRVRVKTDGDSPEPQKCKRTLVIYGSKGKSDDLLLSPQNPGSVCFLPRATDEFIIETGDVGDVYKIRVSCDDMPGFEGWHLKSFHIEELHTKQELNFDCSCWLSLNREGRELVKEFPAVNEDKKILPVYKYVVSVHTGDRWGAETFANVYITLYGKRGDTGVRKLHTSLANRRKFQRNKVDSFLVEAVSLSHLQKVVIQHDGEGYGAGMYLKMVTVKESQDSDKEWVFPCWNWLDTHLGLCETVCEILTVGKRLISSPKLPEINMQSSGLWIMDITGSDLNDEVDPIHLSLIFYGDLNHKKLPLQITGKAIQIKDELAGIGSVYKVQVSGPHSNLKQPWHLDLLHMKHTGTNEEMYLAFDCWFNPNEDKCVELPALYADQEPLPVVEYSIHLHTGDLKKADATGEAYLCIQGERSDSGKRCLNSRNSLITFARGQNMGALCHVPQELIAPQARISQKKSENNNRMVGLIELKAVDVFKIKAVYLGKLNQILVGFKSPKKDDWFLEKIVIKEVIYPFSTHIFVHNDWINKCSKKDFAEVVIPLKETSVTPLLTKEFHTKSQGRWQTWVDCVHAPEDVPDIQIVIFGEKGKSPAQKVQNLNNNPFLVTVGDIGNITKVSFLLSGPYFGRGIKLQKLRLKDLDTKQDLGFSTEAQCLFGEDGSETVTELAAVRPDKTPLREVLYSVSVHMGTLPASGTDADVFITVFGEQGDSCKRRIRHSNFERGQVSVSELRAIDLGLLSQVLVEHSNVGYGAGCYLDQIVIHESGKMDGQYVFLCQQWLDSGVGDTRMERMLRLLGKVMFKAETTIQKYSLDMINISWTNCLSKHFPKLVNTVKMFREERRALSDGDNEESVFLVEACKKMRQKEVKLQHRESKNTLEFPFSRNFADEEGLAVAELPVLIAGFAFPAVKNYILHITTGASPGSGTDADVYVTLQGLLGDTGRRKLARKGDDHFTKGKVDVFQVEAVDVGTLQGVVVEKGKGSDWLLEKIIVKEPAAAGTETLFMAQSWLKDKRDGKRSASVTLNATGQYYFQTIIC